MACRQSPTALETDEGEARRRLRIVARFPADFQAGVAEVFLNRIETAVPPHDVHEKFVSFIPRLLSDERQARLMARLVQKAQIDHRYSVLTPHSDPESLDVDGLFEIGRFTSTSERMNKYKGAALTLAEGPVSALLDRVPSKEISHLIVTSCTGFYAPGLDLDLQKRFKLRSGVERTLIGFMGCYAGINAIKAARHIVRSDATAKVLIVNLELCTLHLQESKEPEQVMAFLQFADGCAASLVSAEPFGLRLDSFRCAVFPEGGGLIRWDVGDYGFDMVLSADVPRVLAQSLPSVWPEIMTDIEKMKTLCWAVHPGGRGILDAVERSLGLDPASLSHSREVLRRYGNMSSATVMFVLKEILSDPAMGGAGAAMAFGPGLTVESMLFNKMLH